MENRKKSARTLHRGRLGRVHALLAEHDAEVVLLSSPPDVCWACGFTGSNGILIVRGEETAHLVTDGRYEEQAAREVDAAEVHVARDGLIGYVEEASLLREGERALFQSERVTVATLKKWKEKTGQVAWKPVEGLVEKLVAEKDESEVRKLSAAQRLTEDVFEHVVSITEAGVTERALAAEIVYTHLRGGAQRMAFDPIVASGPNGALPHARATDRRLQEGDLVVIDMGGVVDGYASDMTRTVAVGEPGEEARAVYEVVRRAQEAALAAARSGMASSALDAAARKVIEEAGYGEAFSHSLGHGLGLRTHEWPTVSYRRDYELPREAVVTIEPGVYLPGRFGVRIEDTVVLHEGRAENLTRARKDLIVC